MNKPDPKHTLKVQNRKKSCQVAIKCCCKYTIYIHVNQQYYVLPSTNTQEVLKRNKKYKKHKCNNIEKHRNLACGRKIQ